MQFSSRPILMISSTSGITSESEMRNFNLYFRQFSTYDCIFRNFMPNIVWNITLRVDDVIDDVTAERQTRPSIFMFNYIEPSCHRNFITNDHFLMILTRYMCPGVLIVNYEFPGQRSKIKVMTSFEMLKSKITKPGISQSIFKLEQNLKDHNVVLLNAYLHRIINFRYNFWFKSLPDLKMAAILKISKYFR